ncbi:MAG: hypothetical protein A3J94_05435 [Syntrophus sp. RIFOXYC2_FULL_54_9]|nr:MAG: hypothetical protein A3J94_05435 [Syntrophus sp. RIFOXYC2_FULL_54_9]HBB15468.1 hypothetical protein [Syntrophus sp. (in: bacteria)]
MGKLEPNYRGFYSDSNQSPYLLWGLAASTENNYTEGERWSSAEPTAAPVLIYDRQIAQLQKEIRELREMLTSAIQLNEPEAPMIELRDISIEQAREEIAKYFLENDGREIDIDELIENLAIDPHTVVRACKILETEGKIG